MNKSTVTIKKENKIDFELACSKLSIGYKELIQAIAPGCVVYQINATHFQKVFELGFYVAQMTFHLDAELI